MGVRAKWLVLWSLWAARAVRQPTAPVALPDGRLLRGQLAPDGSHSQYFGVPYATADRFTRFKAPGPEPFWEGVYEAVDENVRCPQRFIGQLVVGVEDCLRLNVYVPTGATSESLLPVMVFIHGGGFKEGASTRLLYGPDYLVARNVILVTFNYRLSVLGFLCLGTKDAPGNAGMKDQVAALKWIQRNVRAFGGDSDNVTIFGESAGGASVSYHVVSQMSKGLFHKAITQSGSSLAPWAEQHDPIRFAKGLANSLGAHAQDTRELYNVFKDKTIEELLVAPKPVIRGQLILGQILYTPCIEKRIEGVEAFLLDTPQQMLSKGEYNRVPMIIGSNTEEGYFFAAMEDEESLKDVTIESALPHDLSFPSHHQRSEFAEQLRQLYGMSAMDLSTESIIKLSKLHGEPFFIYPSIAETELLLNNTEQPVFNYVLDYNGWRNFPKWISGWRFATAPGASHADDLFYLFSLFPLPTMFEGAIIDTFTTLWTNFAKYGDPTPEGSNVLGPEFRWLESRAAAPHALLIEGARPTEMTPLLRSGSLRAWHRAYTAYRTNAKTRPYRT